MLNSEEAGRVFVLRKLGWGLKRVGRELGMARNTVKAWLKAGPERCYGGPNRIAGLDDHREWIRERWRVGVRNGDVVRQELLATFVAHAENILLLGPSGVGKTHLAIGLGRKVIERGASCLFVSATALVGQLLRAEAEGRLEERLTHFYKPKLLIIDELGYLPFERRAAHLMFQLVNRGYEKGSLMITSNQPVRAWGGVPRHHPGHRDPGPAAAARPCRHH